MPAPTSPTVAIVGAGSVGATLAYALMLRGAARRVVLHDINAAKVHAEVLDLAHGIQFTPMTEVDGSDDVEICRGSQVVVITAGARQKPGQTRMDLAASTVGMMRTIVPRLVEVAPDAVFILVTNPVDVVTQAALALSGLPANRVFGSGTVLDSSRLRYLVSKACRVAVQNVHAYMLGEHGDTEIPVWSAATVGGLPLDTWDHPSGDLGPEVRDEIARQVVSSAYEIIEGKGATNYAIGLAGSRIVEAVLRSERRVLPVSTMLQDWHCISDVCMSVPVLVDADGAHDPLDLPLSDSELTALRASAESIRSTVRSLGF